MSSSRKIINYYTEDHCVQCGEAFSNDNVFSQAGWKETKLSGLCERCFDDAFREAEWVETNLTEEELLDMSNTTNLQIEDGE